ncbi:MAG: hypothetical protein ACRD4H_01130, partial [Candidatus Acidiferrales bacterium]
MKRPLQLGCALAIVAAISTSPLAAPRQQPEQSTAAPDQTPLTPGQIQDLLARVISNQHRNDVTLDTFERLERHVEREGSNSRVREDRLYRVVPTGSGTLKLLVKENSQPVSPGEYQRELRDWERVLEVAIQPDDPRQVAVVAKQKKKLRDRERLINSVSSAYLFTWIAREVRDGRVLEKIQLNPNPA